MMLRYVTSSLVACALAGTVSFAQQAPPSSPPPPQDEQAPAAAKATLTGCVMEAKTTDGTTVYVLDKAEGGSAPLYAMLGSTELASHVNKRVEVTGSVREPNAAPPEVGAPADPKVLRPPIVQVESVKVVADTCNK